MAEPKSAGKASKALKKSVILAVDAPECRLVSVTGDFTQWSESGIPLRKGEDGRWQVSLQLPPGEYQYRLRADGQWKDHADATKRVPNPFGTENCVLIVK
jgi:1,4-alpha-glucan branching enzyme